MFVEPKGRSNVSHFDSQLSSEGLTTESSHKRPDQPKLVLLVDDETSIRTYIKTILEREGLQVIEANDGVDGLTLFRRRFGAVDLVITDLRMPRMTGVELAKVIRAECPMIPVIYISGEPKNHSLHDPANGFYFMEKPFHSKDVLYATHRMLVSRSDAR
jgi:DNA-binding NtrC family response regulator